MNEPIPADILAAWNQGRKIDAIRLLRERTGLGLKEAKEALEAGGLPPARPATPGLSAPARAALQAGHKVEAIRLVRESTGLGLREAKQLVDAAASPQRGLAPGEVPRSRFGAAWAALALVALALLAWWWLRAE